MANRLTCKTVALPSDDIAAIGGCVQWRAHDVRVEPDRRRASVNAVICRLAINLAAMLKVEYERSGAAPGIGPTT
jgi:hypothetical protein